MASYTVVNKEPTVADFWFNQPLVDENGAFKTDDKGAIKVERMVVRSITNDRLTSLNNSVAQEHADLLNKITEQNETITALQKRITQLEAYVPDTAKYTVKSLTGANAYTITPKKFGIYDITLTAANSRIIMDSTGLPSNYLVEARVYLTQGTGANTITWDDKIKWINNITPSLSSLKGSIDVIQFSTLDGGKTWKGIGITDLNYVVVC